MRICLKRVTLFKMHREGDKHRECKEHANGTHAQTKCEEHAAKERSYCCQKAPHDWQKRDPYVGHLRAKPFPGTETTEYFGNAVNDKYTADTDTHNQKTNIDAHGGERKHAKSRGLKDRSSSQ